MITEWPRSIRPDQRDGRWNAMFDRLADAYRGLEDSDQFRGVQVKVIDGAGQAFLIAEVDGELVRIPVVSDQAESAA